LDLSLPISPSAKTAVPRARSSSPEPLFLLEVFHYRNVRGAFGRIRPSAAAACSLSSGSVERRNKQLRHGRYAFMAWRGAEQVDSFDLDPDIGVPRANSMMILLTSGDHRGCAVF